MEFHKLCLRLSRYWLTRSSVCTLVNYAMVLSASPNTACALHTCTCTSYRTHHQESSKSHWPTAKRRSCETMYGKQKTVDHYSWMKMAGQTQELRDYISQEQRLTKIFMQENQPFWIRILKRLRQLNGGNTTTEFPIVMGRGVYFRKMHKGSWKYYRRHHTVGNNDACTVFLFDTAKITAMYGHPVTISAVKISPNEDYVAFIVETTGTDTYEAHVVRIGSNGRAVVVDTLKNVLSLEFAHHDILYYTKMNGLRAAEVWQHHIGQDRSKDHMILEEDDKKFFVDLSHTKDRLYITINTNSSTTSEVHLLDINTLSTTLVCPRQAGVQYFVEHNQGMLYILTNAQDNGEYLLLTCPISQICNLQNLMSDSCKTFFKPEDGCHIVDMDMFADHCVLCTTVATRPRVIVIPLGGKKKTSVVELPEHFSQLTPGPNATSHAEYFQFSLSSPVHLTANFHLKITGTSSPQIIPYNYHQSGNEVTWTDKGKSWKKLTCTRLWTASQNGTAVPITVFHKDNIRLTGSNPMLVHGYGAYGVTLDMSYDQHTAVLMELGWVVAYCHVRGGSNLGIQWHHSGRAFNKMKSFEDFEASIMTLQRLGYSQPQLTALHGISAGGLLVAAVCNRVPHLVQAAVLQVPFVDVLSTMLDSALPLTHQDIEEWGDPLNDPEAFDYIMSYCPYQNITNQRYPAMLVTTSVTDTRVPVWVPLKYVAKLRHMMSLSQKFSDSLLLLVQNEGGHFGELDHDELVAIETAFLYKSLGLEMDWNF